MKLGKNLLIVLCVVMLTINLTACSQTPQPTPLKSEVQPIETKKNTDPVAVEPMEMVDQGKTEEENKDNSTVENPKTTANLNNEDQYSKIVAEMDKTGLFKQAKELLDEVSKCRQYNTKTGSWKGVKTPDEVFEKYLALSLENAKNFTALYDMDKTKIGSTFNNIEIAASEIISSIKAERYEIIEDEFVVGNLQAGIKGLDEIAREHNLKLE